LTSPGVLSRVNKGFMSVPDIQLLTLGLWSAIGALYGDHPEDRATAANAVKNKELEQEVLLRTRVEEELRNHRENLETPVGELTRELRESEERYRIFFETSRDGVFMTRLDGRFIDFNDVAPVSKQGVSKEYPLELLIVDDEQMIRDLGTRILTKAGYTVITASNGKEALDVYEQRGDEIAFVILDLIMPEMGGKQCLQSLLELNPSTKVIIASGYSVDGTTAETLSSGARGGVNKPYDVRQLLGFVREVPDAE
jgi:CheY-like chemotaxis protein